MSQRADEPWVECPSGELGKLALRLRARARRRRLATLARLALAGLLALTALQLAAARFVPFPLGGSSSTAPCHGGGR